MPLFDVYEGCSTCPLKKEWPKLHSPRMPLALPLKQSPYRLLAVGEAPGSEEDRYGVPFVGKTGQYLRDHLPASWREKLYWTNIVKCRPPGNRPPSDQEILCCSREFTEKYLLACKPHAVLAVGGIALNYFWGSTGGPNISHIRGVPFPVELSDKSTSWCYPIFHPSYVNRAERTSFDDGSVLNTVLPIFQSDIKKFFQRVPEFASNPPTIAKVPTNILYPKTAEETLNLFNQLKEPYAFDIETHGMKPYMRDNRILTAACSDGDITFAFVIDWPGGLNPWGKETLTTIMRSKKRWIAQNSLFELKWIWYLTDWFEQNFDDTEILARLHHQRTGLGSLDVLTRIYLGLDVKKLTNLDKSRLVDYPVEKVLKYNALDAWSEYLVYHKLVALLDSVQLANYYRSIESVKSTVAMELKGLPVDLQESEKLEDELHIKSDIIEKQAHQLIEVLAYEKKEQQIFHISSTHDVAKVLVDYCNIKLPKTESDNYSTDESVLEKIADKHPLINLTLDHREVQKLRSTYVRPLLSLKLIGIDGLLHPAYTVVHTATYRLSSYDPNCQNFPKRKNSEIRRQIVSRPGYVFVAFDYGQLEGRVIQMFSGDPELKRAFIENDDIHWKWLYRIIDLHPAYMDHLARVSGETEEKKILKAGRTIIKTDFVFPSFYGSEANALSNRTGIPRDITEEVMTEFWSCYPLARNWVDNQFKKYEETGCVESLTHRIRNQVLSGNEPCNSPCQGTAAEIVLEAQNAIFNRAITEDMNLLPRINVHDDIVFELPDTDDELEHYIGEISTEIVKPRFDFISCPLMSEARVGYNWKDLSEIGTFTGSWYENGQLITV
jgi:uracil-DNA glycosylase family 4